MRFLAIVKDLFTRECASSKTSGPAGNDEGSGAVIFPNKSHFQFLRVKELGRVLLRGGDNKEDLQPRRSCDCRKTDGCAGSTPYCVFNGTRNHTVITCFPALKRR